MKWPSWLKPMQFPAAEPLDTVLDRTAKWAVQLGRRAKVAERMTQVLAMCLVVVFIDKSPETWLGYALLFAIGGAIYFAGYRITLVVLVADIERVSRRISKEATARYGMERCKEQWKLPPEGP